MRLTVTASGPAIDVARLAGAVPILIERCRTIGYEPDGTAVVDGERSTAIRLIDGVGGQPGATYDLGGALGGPAQVTVETDTLENLGVQFHGVAEHDTQDGLITLDRPVDPERLRLDGTMTSQEKTPVLGSRVELNGVLEVATLIGDTYESGPPTPAVGGRSARAAPHGTATLVSKAGRIEANCRVHRSGGRWGVTVSARIRPRGLLVLAAPVWPFVRGRVAAAVARSISEFLTGAANSLAAEFGPGDGPQQVADRVWQQLVDEQRKAGS